MNGSIKVQGQPIIEITHKNTTISEILDGYVIGLLLNFEWAQFVSNKFKEPGDSLEIHMQGVDIYIGTESTGCQPIAYGASPRKWYISSATFEVIEEYSQGEFQTSKFRNSNGYVLNIPINSILFEKTDSLREGGNLNLCLTLYGTLSSSTKKTYINEGKSLVWSDDFRIRIPQSDWVDKLNNVNRSISLLVETPIENIGLVGYVKSAKEYYHAGNYAGCVADCRKAMENLLAGSGLPSFGDTMQKNKAERESMNLRERLALLVQSAAHVTHLAHHDTGTNTEFSRPEARTILSTTVSLVSLASDGYFKIGGGVDASSVKAQDGR